MQYPIIDVQKACTEIAEALIDTANIADRLIQAEIAKDADPYIPDQLAALFDELKYHFKRRALAGGERIGELVGLPGLKQACFTGQIKILLAQTDARVGRLMRDFGYAAQTLHARFPETGQIPFYAETVEKMGYSNISRVAAAPDPAGG